MALVMFLVDMQLSGGLGRMEGERNDSRDEKRFPRKKASQSIFIVVQRFYFLECMIGRIVLYLNHSLSPPLPLT